MGRKIPGKKHRGVKDPEKQHAKRLAELDGKINAPPRDDDEQTIPKSLENIIRLKEATKTGRIEKFKKKKKKKSPGLICVGLPSSKPLHPKAKPEKSTPIFKQQPGETNRHFMCRVHRDTNDFLNETAFEDKYNVQVDRNLKTGKVEGLSKRSKNEIDELERLKAKHKNIKKKKKNASDDTPNLSKAQKRKQKLQIKKEKKQENDVDGFKVLYDEVKFGEVVHAPPTLKTRPRKADVTDTMKPGKRDLLLKSLLGKDELSTVASVKSLSIDRQGKRKNLPLGERRQLEQQQSDIIAEYRRVKAQRSVNT